MKTPRLHKVCLTKEDDEEEEIQTVSQLWVKTSWSRDKHQFCLPPSFIEFMHFRITDISEMSRGLKETYS